MKQTDGIERMMQRRSNAKRIDEPWVRFTKEQIRKKIETSLAQIKALFLRTIHALTFKGFLLKLMLFIMAFTLNQIA